MVIGDVPKVTSAEKDNRLKQPNFIRKLTIVKTDTA